MLVHIIYIELCSSWYIIPDDIIKLYIFLINIHTNIKSSNYNVCEARANVGLIWNMEYNGIAV